MAAARRVAFGVCLIMVLMASSGDARELRATEPASCFCTADYTPVCDPVTGKTYSNACVARCNNVTSTRPGECPTPPTNEGCICTAQYDPVCDQVTNTTYGNACTARCAGASNTVPGECSGTSTTPGPSPCICTREYNPVCDTLTNTTYGNPCEARCARANWTAPGACSVSAARCASRCPKVPNGPSSTSDRNVYDPVCVISRAARGATRPNTVSFFNPCIAQCYSTSSAVLGNYKGLCSATADAACASGVRAGAQICSITTATEYPTRCYAQQFDGSRVTFYNGQCRQPEATQLAAKCPPATPEYPVSQVYCFADPCSVASPCSDATARCVSRYCGGYFRNTYLSGLCQAVFIKRDGSINTACTFGTSG